MECEVCKREIDGNYSYVQIVTVSNDHITQKLRTKHVCCPDCLSRFKIVLHDLKFERKLPGRAGLILDDPKIYALRKAGWSYEKIADEMGCSTAAIKRHLDIYEEKLNERKK